MAYGEAQKKASMKYAKRSLKRIPLDVQKEKYEEIKAAANRTGETVNGYIKATPHNCACGAFPQNSARILLRKLEIHTVFLRFRAAFGHYFSGEIALAELCGVALNKPLMNVCSGTQRPPARKEYDYE